MRSWNALAADGFLLQVAAGAISMGERHSDMIRTGLLSKVTAMFALACWALAQATSGAPAQVASVELVPDAPFVSNVVDLEVFNTKHERLGEVVDLALDPNATVRGYVIAVGGQSGSGERHVLVPASSLRIAHASGGKWTAEMDASPDQLKAVPTIPYKSGWNQ